MSSNDPPRIQRLFFALWPERALQEAGARLARRLLSKRGKRVQSENLHITLAFLGNMTAQQRVCAEAVADLIAAIAFELRLEQIGYWPRSQVVWISPQETPEPLRDLVQQLNTGLMTCGCQPELRPYRAHMTLARKVAGHFPTRQVSPILWFVDRFCLVQSVTQPAGAQYRILRTWPLVKSAGC